jgi:hypothetical protein
VADWGYDEWKIRKATVKAVTYAVVADEGFAWPYFDNTIGPFLDDGEGGTVGLGDIRVRIFGPNEVYWEPGIDFEDSKWHAVEYAKPIEEIYQLPGYTGGKLKADADASDTRDETKTETKNLGLVTEYLERPSMKNPQGLWMVLANDREIMPRRPFPCVDAQGRPVDEPVLHKLAYFTDPDSDRDMGLVRHLLDAQRTVNDCTNKQLEWKNLTLMPQWVMLPGVFGSRQRRTDEPGAMWTVNSLDGFKQLDVPQIPQDLQEIKDEAKADIGRISAQNDIPNQIEAGKAIATFTERDSSRRAEFLANLADFHSRLMRHCLYLVQRHFAEDRLLRITGPFGPVTRSFRGADLQGEVDVRVLPGSIEPLTKDGVLNTVTQLAELFPNQISLDKALQAINSANMQFIDQGYQLQVEKQQREIKKAIALGPTLTPGATPEQWAQAGIPIAEPQDDDQVHLDVLHQFMETEQFDNQPEVVKESLQLHEQQHRQQQSTKAVMAQQQQMTAAAQLGMQNAASPQGQIAAPDTSQSQQPSPQASPSATTPS